MIITCSLIVLKNAKVELHGHVEGLVVEGHQLAAGVPEDVRQEVGAVHPRQQQQLPLESRAQFLGCRFC